MANAFQVLQIHFSSFHLDPVNTNPHIFEIAFFFICGSAFRSHESNKSAHQNGIFLKLFSRFDFLNPPINRIRADTRTRIQVAKSNLGLNSLELVGGRGEGGKGLKRGLKHSLLLLLLFLLAAQGIFSTHFFFWLRFKI